MQEQEPSVTDILSSIRQILSNKIGEDHVSEASYEAPKFDLTDEQESSSTSEGDSFSAVPLSMDEDVLVLTPQMKVEMAIPEEDIQPVQGQMLNDSSFVAEPITPDKIEQNLQPVIQHWLDKHLPQMVERIVSEEVRRIFNKR